VVGLHPVTDFKVRAFNAKAVTDLREKLMKPFQTMLRAGLPIPDEKNEEIGLRVVTGAVLVDWKGVELEGEAVQLLRRSGLHAAQEAAEAGEPDRQRLDGRLELP
jgi:hypothetical protein